MSQGIDPTVSSRHVVFLHLVLYLNVALGVLGVRGAPDDAAPPVPLLHAAHLQPRLRPLRAAGLQGRGGRGRRARPRGRPGLRGRRLPGLDPDLGLGVVPRGVSGRVARGVLGDDEEALPHELLAHLRRHDGRITV